MPDGAERLIDWTGTADASQLRSDGWDVVAFDELLTAVGRRPQDARGALTPYR